MNTLHDKNKCMTYLLTYNFEWTLDIYAKAVQIHQAVGDFCGTTVKLVILRMTLIQELSTSGDRSDYFN
ncbi:hypothetical protein KIN20_005798 [Parelaphostrongylus tenuis]|uniref:Uncharacterized protein n=1 Tax=Parelaphostrongylus tenuis TaxID=148309 RepID=A0AAD5M0W7_PARTN|nr:hypothetical protein KIN20_005798 [Parelaphostrongylus tenuis]